MKSFYLLLFFFSIALTQAQIIDIPDTNFKNTLVNDYCVDTNGDGWLDGDADTNDNGEIEVSEAEAVYLLDISDTSNYVSSIEGIEYFINLVSLNCEFNSLTEIDLSANTQLTHLFLGYNQLAELDLSQNTLLTDLRCNYNELINLDLGSNTQLSYLDCADNEITDLDLSSNTELTNLICTDNQLSNLNISQCTLLTNLRCYFNQLTNLDLTSNTELVDLDCFQNQITNLDLSQNILLENLSCQDNQITSLDLSQNIQLTNVSCGYNQLTSIDFSSASLIEYLYCSNNFLITINVSDMPSLISLSCSENDLSSLDVSQNINLEYLDTSANNIASLNLSNNVALDELFVYDNALAILDVTQNVNLGRFYCGGNPLSEIDVTQNVNLFDLYLGDCEISELDVTQNVNLEHLVCRDNQLTALDVTLNLNLEWLFCEGNELIHLDVSENQELFSLYCNNNNLVTLFLKNGSPNISTSFNNNPDLIYICADEFNFEDIHEELDLYGMTGVAVNSYCSFTPGGEYSTLEGTSQIDLNLDGCDSNDSGHPYTKLTINDGLDLGVMMSDENGDYFLPLSNGSYTIAAPIFENSAYIVQPENLSVNIPADGENIIQDFCITPNGIVDDLEIIIIPINEARPGFDAFYKLFYRNKGNTTLSGSINFTFDDDYMDLVSATPDADNTSTGNLDWNYSDLMPFESGEIDIVMNLNTPTDENFPLNDGDLLSFNAIISPVADDTVPEDNASSLRQIVVNSYDPNDKRCLEGEILDPDLVGEYVHYMIRFENTGSASAINIVVKDVIDTSKFDISTLTPLHASHNFVTRIQNTNEVEFIFENIYLPFDDANNDGFVVFKIKTLDTLVLGDTFTNDAEIYFDFNAPIITNNYLTTVAEDNLSIDEFTSNSSVKLFPNPVKDVLTISSKVNLRSISIADVNGRILETIAIVGNQVENSIDIKHLSKGVYFVTVKTDKGSSTEKMIKN
ncbi:T9SS type A sorting domain-containing protein [Psychroserpens mesophilus]|uniref:T9SS type A sorting domain-containing protein n=1 Tax=Psychroserpens mesophilus TaxID=325473 RepID=UPI000693DAE0|nr:T9SS type A sorting domain-containing protein [Psychroserpens mesophilus]